MIPRFKPSIGSRELRAALQQQPGAVADFESTFARHFDATEGIAFNYGRTALLALLKSLSIAGQEVIVPAYTCSVVAYAVTISGNSCRFVDAEPGGYNMDLAQLEEAIGERTRMVIATHIFGIPANVDAIAAIVERASRRWGHKIWVVQDCAHGFGTRWRGRQVSQAGDVALFGLGISKMLTSIFGGMLTTGNCELATTIRAWRDANCQPSSPAQALRQRAYLYASTAAFSAPIYGAVRWLQDETALLDGVTKAYHMDGIIRLPPDALAGMSDVSAQVGLAQLARYPEFEARRIAHARHYHQTLTPPHDWVLPPDVDGATYSHFPIHVADRDNTLKYFLNAGIQLGQLIEYSVPHLAEYGSAPASEFPNSWASSRHIINLPVHPDLSDRDRARVIDCVNAMPKDSAHTADAA